jgi:hypothetical protein
VTKVVTKGPKKVATGLADKLGTVSRTGASLERLDRPHHLPLAAFGFDPLVRQPHLAKLASADRLNRVDVGAVHLLLEQPRWGPFARA